MVMQIFNGLSYATTLFLMAAGLTLIFGVTRIVNFAHGSFFMLGALLGGHTLVHWWPAAAEQAWSYLLVMLGSALVCGALGWLVERLLLRRLYGVPELYQLVATFGLSLLLHDLMLWLLGPQEVFAPRFPGLKGALQWGDAYFPVYQIVLIVLGPLVWWGLHLLLTRSSFGLRLQAATQDRAMLAALGVNPAPLMAGAVVLGCALAGLGGALQLPREPAHLHMDLNMVVETFVVVVTGGLGSIAGAFGAAVLIGLVHSFGLELVPQATLVLVFLTMALVLAIRPQGLAGAALAAQAEPESLPFDRGGPRRLLGVAAAVLAAAGLSVWAGPYWTNLVGHALILVLFGLSLQAMMALGAMVSFGHAAYFGLGAYAAALVHRHWNLDLVVSLVVACLLVAVLAALLGAVLVRRSGVYLAMLSLALAQMVWAGASQWVELTGGDNGIIGLQWLAEDERPGFQWTLAAIVVVALWWTQRLAGSSLGAALQAVRDAPLRAAASAIPIWQVRLRVYCASAVLAALAGGLFAAHQGSVFPSVASVATSVDALLVLLLGGMHHLAGTLVGATVLVWAGAELGREFAYWKGLLGVLVMAIMVVAPSGVLGWRRQRRAASEAAA